MAAPKAPRSVSVGRSNPDHELDPVGKFELGEVVDEGGLQVGLGLVAEPEFRLGPRGLERFHYIPVLGNPVARPEVTMELQATGDGRLIQQRLELCLVQQHRRHGRLAHGALSPRRRRHRHRDGLRLRRRPRLRQFLLQLPLLGFQLLHPVLQVGDPPLVVLLELLDHAAEFSDIVGTILGPGAPG